MLFFFGSSTSVSHEPPIIVDFDRETNDVVVLKQTQRCNDNVVVTTTTTAASALVPTFRERYKMKMFCTPTFLLFSLGVSSLHTTTTAWIVPSSRCVVTTSSGNNNNNNNMHQAHQEDPVVAQRQRRRRRRRRQLQLYGFPNPFQNFGWGGRNTNQDNHDDSWQSEQQNYQHNGYSNPQFHEENGGNWQPEQSMNYEEEQQYDGNDYYYGNQDQQQEYDYYKNDDAESYYENTDDYRDSYNNHEQAYDSQQQEEYSQNDQYYDDSQYSDAQPQQQQQEQQYYDNENQHDYYDDDRTAALTNGDSSSSYSNPQDVMRSNYGYHGDGSFSLQTQQDYYYQNPRSRPRNGWKISIEQQQQLYRPPQLGAMNRLGRRRPRGDPFDFFLDDFFSFDPFDRMFSSPFDDFFPSPFSSSRRRRATRPRRRVTTSPLSSMMMDLAVPPRIVSPFSSFDRSIEEQMRSMMEQSRNMMARSDADPMFQRRILEQAERYLNADIACTTALGQPIQMGPIISQSSSSRAYIVNGRRSRQEETMMQVSVRGSQGRGVVRIVAMESGIQNMVLQVADKGNGFPPREINVQLSANTGGPPPSAGNSNNEGGPEIVDAEIVEHSNDSNRPVRNERWSMTPV
jgi:hypothetical protein